MGCGMHVIWPDSIIYVITQFYLYLTVLSVLRLYKFSMYFVGFREFGLKI